MIRTFKSKDQVEAIEFADSDKETIQSIIAFTGMSVNIEYAPNGTVRAGLIRDAKSVSVVNLGQFIYKDNNGQIGVCDLEYLEQNYEEVEEEFAS
ncbi:hypothetical protein [Paenibacillus motobuensis]|uniref:YopX protein domain-containing protein n=1 Tax=Paenibacillus motobuensis TaxID=295324 RepID=A0ABP3I532_9BACL